MEEVNKENTLLRTENDEFKQLKVDCDNRIRELENLLSDKDVQIQRLSEQVDSLQDNSDSSCDDDCFDNITLAEIHNPVGETNSEFESLQNGGTLARSLNLSDSSLRLRKTCSSDDTQLLKVRI